MQGDISEENFVRISEYSYTCLQSAFTFNIITFKTVFKEHRNGMIISLNFVATFYTQVYMSFYFYLINPL
jgi:hypothetical protein